MTSQSKTQPLQANQVEDRVRQVISHLQTGQARAAYDLAGTLLAQAPMHAGAAYAWASCMLALKDYDVALEAVQRSIALDGKLWESHYLEGRIHKARGQLESAAVAYRRATNLRPDIAIVHTSLGIALRGLGQLDEAIDAYDKALALDPASYEARHNLGNALKQAGRTTEAAEALTQSGAHRRAEAMALNDKALALRLAPNLGGALLLLERAAELAPEIATIHNNLGGVLLQSLATRESLPHFQRAYELTPTSALALRNLGSVHAMLGEVEEADRYFAIARRLHPDDGATQMRDATLLPAVQPSTASIAAWRQRYQSRVEERLAHPLVTSRHTMLMAHPSFYLSYHGLGNLEIARALSGAISKALPELSWRAPHVARGPRQEGPLRVGFISSLMRNHSIGKTTRGLIAELDRTRFEVHALFVPPYTDDTLARFIRERADASLVLADDLLDAREQVAQLELDVLFYQDVGMDMSTYYLAHARLAPVQCLSFGHPDTTGIPTMDYFVSSSLFEPPDATAHYSERLHLIEGVGTLAYYYRPQLQQLVEDRQHFGFDFAQHLYLCPQTLFKVHPDFDALVAGILRADPHGIVVFIADREKSWSVQLHARIAREAGDVIDRVRFIDPLPSDAFLNLIAVADVMLDTTHFNGMNTSLEAFAVGTPVVTLPQAFQRGRHTSAMYRRMGLDDLVAVDEADYVAKAVQLGTDAAYRAAVSASILQCCSVLFEDAVVVRGFEDFFEQACRDYVDTTH